MGVQNNAIPALPHPSTIIPIIPIIPQFAAHRPLSLIPSIHPTTISNHHLQSPFYFFQPVHIREVFMSCH
jgi:hypothetical protein